jgi:uncharacterized protein
MLDGQINSLFRYPVKGLTGEALRQVALSAGQGFPADRLFGFVRHGSGFDPAQPQPLPKDRFLMLMKDERLAGLETRFDPESWDFEIRVQGYRVHEANLSLEDGRSATEAFFARMFDIPLDEMPRFVHATPHRFTDVSVVSPALMNAVSLINLESLRDFEMRLGKEILPARFRANIYFDGWPAFSELDLVGRQIMIGEARAIVTLRTRRCAATEVNPKTARRDIPVPRLLMQHYGHSDLGIYAELQDNAVIEPGSRISFEGAI